MKISSHFILLLLLTSCKSFCSTDSLTIISHTNKNISYEGRIGKNTDNSASEIYWSGSSIKINFKGTKASISLDDQNGTNYFNVIIDGIPSRVLKLEKGKKEYLLADNLLDKKHSIALTKRNEWTFGKTLFFNFTITGELLEKEERKPLFIEFYGDSITTGHGNEDYSGNDEPEGNVTNNYNAYNSITARAINAEYSCIARGGIGIMVSWFDMIIPEMYYLLNPNEVNSKWDFTSKQPDIVVINLFQNDSWIVKLPENEQYKRRFGTKKPDETKIIKEYSYFIKTIRKKYSDASIICLLGNMDITKKKSEWPSYVQKAVNSLNDNKIYTCFVPYKDSPGHPKVEEHRLIASKLTEFIKEIMK